MKKLKIFSDGACLGNPGPGGYCSIITDGKKRFVIKDGENYTTNNRMELLAVIVPLEKIKNSYQINLYTDSKYVIEGINSWLEKWVKNGWKTSSGKHVENKDLWERLYNQLKRHQITTHWIKGHSGHPENEYCDKIAKQEALKFKNEKK